MFKRFEKFFHEENFYPFLWGLSAILLITRGVIVPYGMLSTGGIDGYSRWY